MFATANNNTISINDGTTTTNSGVLNTGDCYVFDMGDDGYSGIDPDVITISATNPICCYQVTGVCRPTKVKDELGSALLPSIYSISQMQLSFYSYEVDVSDYNRLFLLFRSGSENDFTLSYGTTTITPTITTMNVPGLPDWKAAKYEVPDAARNQVVTIKNTSSMFSVGYFNLHQTAGGASFGYLSAFGTFVFPDTMYKCHNESIVLDAGYGETYYWTLPNGSHPTTATITATDPGTYSVIVSKDPLTITASTTVINYATVNGGTIKTAMPQEYCYGTTPSILYGVIPASGGTSNYTYLWESSTDTGKNKTWTPLGVSTQTYTVITPLTQTTYYRRLVTDSHHCDTVSSDTLEIKINPLPVISVSDTALCTGVIRELFPYTGGVWTSSASNIAEVSSNNIFVTGKSAGTATLTFTDTNRCSANMVVTVKDYPKVAKTTGPNVVCEGASVSLSNDTLGGVWTTGSTSKVSFSSPSANPVTVTGVNLGKTYITYTVSDGACETKTTFPIKVISNTPPTIRIGFEK
jgi:hypothetical protein